MTAFDAHKHSPVLDNMSVHPLCDVRVMQLESNIAPSCL